MFKNIVRYCGGLLIFTFGMIMYTIFLDINMPEPMLHFLLRLVVAFSACWIIIRPAFAVVGMPFMVPLVGVLSLPNHEYEPCSIPIVIACTFCLALLYVIVNKK